MSQASAPKGAEAKRKDEAPAKASWASIASSGTPPPVPAALAAPAASGAKSHHAAPQPAGPAPVTVSAPPVWPGAQNKSGRANAEAAAAAAAQQPPAPTPAAEQPAAKQDASSRPARPNKKSGAPSPASNVVAPPAAPAAAKPAAAPAASAPKRQTGVCRSAEQCQRPDCRFTHPNGRVLDGTFQGQPASQPQQSSAPQPVQPPPIPEPAAQPAATEPLPAERAAPEVRPAPLEAPQNAAAAGLLPSNFSASAALQAFHTTGSHPDSLLDTPPFAPHPLDPAIDPNARLQPFHPHMQQHQQYPQQQHGGQYNHQRQQRGGHRGGFHGQQHMRGNMPNGHMHHEGPMPDARAHSPGLDQFQGGRGFNPAFMPFPPQPVGYNFMPGGNGFQPYPVPPEFQFQQYFDAPFLSFGYGGPQEMPPADPRHSVPCRFDTKCRRPDCFYVHANGREIDGTAGGNFYAGGGRNTPPPNFGQQQNGPHGFGSGGPRGGQGFQNRSQAFAPLTVDGDSGGQFNDAELEELNAAFEDMISQKALEDMSPQDRDEYLQYEMQSDSFTDDEEYDYPEHLHAEVNNI
eukprot:TRINITY_DN285_c0_g1_i1.p1 TRINITY_DN285_c0_g1~~TRINITY_DN285_c0_g1_i1.p1  ORF type:complete len:573 (+),score=211.76 TRINITY_DN285_c0_g1_i1:164-1882(+)